jgi:hypothetical protein
MEFHFPRDFTHSFFAIFCYQVEFENSLNKTFKSVKIEENYCNFEVIPVRY